MKFCEGKIGRIFMLKLENGDILPDCIENFARKEQILAGHVLLVGGASNGQIVMGPRKSDEMPPEPLLLPVYGAHEIVGVGILAPDENNRPILHMHASLGRSGKTLTGCIRPGIQIWLTGEAIIYELIGISVKRTKDRKSGFTLMEIQ